MSFLCDKYTPHPPPPFASVWNRGVRSRIGNLRKTSLTLFLKYYRPPTMDSETFTFISDYYATRSRVPLHRLQVSALFNLNNFVNAYFATAKDKHGKRTGPLFGCPDFHYYIAPSASSSLYTRRWLTLFNTVSCPEHFVKTSNTGAMDNVPRTPSYLLDVDDGVVDDLGLGQCLSDLLPTLDGLRATYRKEPISRISLVPPQYLEWARLRRPTIPLKDFDRVDAEMYMATLSYMRTALKLEGHKAAPAKLADTSDPFGALVRLARVYSPGDNRVLADVLSWYRLGYATFRRKWPDFVIRGGSMKQPYTGVDP